MKRDKYFAKRLLGPALALALAAAVLAARPSRAGFSPRAPIPADASVFSADKGKLRILINGQPVGSEDFEISQSGGGWVERSSTSAHAPGSADIKATGQLSLAADGTPIRYEWSAEAQKKATGSVDFVSGTAKCSGDFGMPSLLRKDFVFTSPRIAVLDNNLYYQFGVLARIYDWKTRGKQTFPVVIPQDMVPGTISVESLGQQQSGIGKYEALRVSSPDLEIMVYLDSNHRMMRLEVPSSNAIIERE
ncbi:MAG: hypothetical protein WCA19_18050 [Candidatus Acidiferrales bacterium]